MKIGFLLSNLFACFIIARTSSIHSVETSQNYGFYVEHNINISSRIKDREGELFCDRRGPRNVCDKCTGGYTRCRDICDNSNCWHGRCEINLEKCDEYKCICYEGYTGDRCDECLPGYVKDKYWTSTCVKDQCAGVSCSGRGTCVMNFYKRFCECNEGYYGQDCEVPDNCLDEDCTKPFEQCVARELEKPKCECEIGYVRNAETKQCEKNPCATVSCPVNEACVKKGGDTVACECIGGYVRNPETQQCEEDICTSDMCEQNQECVRRGETSSCECKSGYIEYNSTCVADECKKGDDVKNICNDHGVCYMKEGEGRCDCYENYAGDYCNDCKGHLVKDRATDECIENLCKRDTCNMKGKCFMENGQPKCEDCAADREGDYCEICKPCNLNEQYGYCPKNALCIDSDVCDKICCICEKGTEDDNCDDYVDFPADPNLTCPKSIKLRSVSHFNLHV